MFLENAAVKKIVFEWKTSSFVIFVTKETCLSDRTWSSNRNVKTDLEGPDTGIVRHHSHRGTRYRIFINLY